MRGGECQHRPFPLQSSTVRVPNYREKDKVILLDSIYAVLGHAHQLNSFLVPMWTYLVRWTLATVFKLLLLSVSMPLGYFWGFGIIAPFLVLILLSVPQIHPANSLLGITTPDWNQLVSVLYWGYSGLDATGVYASEIASPQ
ncbi:hypothetical protein PsorP6_003869 [Peronosclerospora sorghi]|uniref:Uncharacterized protein n=1 Tax=Peronosclerospora sorghi TaxID=230839 RepID=A0ACC0VJZ5_9STRA|nr:hypothetical protein PsorP6_003869 [Peronosclerospora sorghi]